MATRGIAPEWYNMDTFIFYKMDQTGKLAYDIFKNILDKESTEELTSIEKNFFTGDYRDAKDTDKGEKSLYQEMIALIMKAKKAPFLDLVDLATPIVKERIAKRLNTNMKNNHALQNYFRIEDFDNERIVRIKPDGSLVVPTRNGSKPFTGEPGEENKS